MRRADERLEENGPSCGRMITILLLLLVLEVGWIVFMTYVATLLALP